MENLMFCLNATGPIFLMMVFGLFLRKVGILDEDFANRMNKFVFKIPLPFLLFSDLAAVDFSKVWNIKFIVFCFVVTLISITISTLVSCLWRDKSIRGEFIQASYRSSAALLGIAFIQNIYGSSAMGPLMIVSAVPLYNIFSVIVLTFEANDSTGIDKKAKIRQAGINICKNPIILSILAGLIVGLLGIQFPTLVNKTVSNVAQMATPLALITIGAGFEGRKALAKIAPTMAASMIKLVLQPIIENAIYHGLKYKESKGLLIIKGFPKDGNAVLQVIDDGVGMDEETLAHIYDRHKVNYHSNGVGVYNVQKRLKLYYGEDYGITYESAPGEGTTATITIPGRQEGQK